MIGRKFGERSQVFQKTTFIDEDTELGINDLNVVVDSSSNTVAATLPPVAEAIGLIFTFEVPDGDTNACTVQDSDDSYAWSDVTLNGADDKAAFYSTGRMWIQIGS